MTPTIGFATQFYTLWEVHDPRTEPVYYNGVKVGEVTKQDVIYVQNLSTDIDKAKSKASDLCGTYVMDLDLRGCSSFERTISSHIKNRDEYFPVDCFSFGMMEGLLFFTSDDVWQLERAMKQESNPRRRVLARRRLIDLGFITKHDGRYINPSDIDEYDRIKWISGLVKAHHYLNGSKIELELMEVGAGSFNGNYGTTYIRSYATPDGKLLKYMGSSPIDVSDSYFVKVTATIKHDSYNGQDETKLLRIKII